ncbi:MAG TPA: hypothetical protein VH583_11105 [Vicinamibacterales bacterium]|jgi:hypothetical protein
MNGRHASPGLALPGFAAIGTAVGALAIGAVAAGAFAIGVLAVRRMAIRNLVVDGARFRSLEIGELTVKRLRAEEVIVAESLTLPQG